MSVCTQRTPGRLELQWGWMPAKTLEGMKILKCVTLVLNLKVGAGCSVCVPVPPLAEDSTQLSDTLGKASSSFTRVRAFLFDSLLMLGAALCFCWCFLHKMTWIMCQTCFSTSVTVCSRWAVTLTFSLVHHVCWRQHDSCYHGAGGSRLLISYFNRFKQDYEHQDWENDGCHRKIE